MNNTYLNGVKDRHQKATVDPDAVSSSLSDIPVLLRVMEEYDKAESAVKDDIKAFYERYHIWSNDSYFPDIIKRFASEADRIVIGSEAAYKRMVGDTLNYFRALVIVTEMVANAGTHAEKAARLRGLVETLESGISRLQDEQFKIIDHYWSVSPDLFKSDYPVREYKRRVYELEQRLEKYERAEIKPEVQPESDETF